MRNCIDYNQSATGLVQKYIGCGAFDVIKYVAENLDVINGVVGQLDSGDIHKIAQAVDHLQELLDRLVFFNNIYYGPLNTVPTTRPDGTPIVNGDIYYNIPLGRLNVRENGIWVSVGEQQSSIQVFDITSTSFNAQGEVELRLNNQYNPGSNGIMVFVNATYQYSISKDRPNGVYTEKDPNTLFFPSGTLEAGDKVVVVVGSVLTNADNVVSVETGLYQVKVSGESVVTLPGNMFYTPGTNNLEVIVDGQYFIKDIDYYETDERTVSFRNGLPAGAVILFKKGQVVSTGLPAGSVPTVNKFEVLNIAAEFQARGASLPTDATVFLKGYKAIGDGGYGAFVYDGSLDRGQANGGTLIDATVNIAQQGTGSGLGLWVRQYAHEIEPEWFGIGDPLVKHLPDMGMPRHGDTVSLDGYRVVGDGGEGSFWWDGSRPASDHDGALVIDPRKSFPDNWADITAGKNWFTPNVQGQGCWVRLNPELADITWFGATGDGRTDNSIVFEAVAKSVEQGNINRILVPKGEFVISGTAGFKLDRVKTEFKLEGIGVESILSFPVGSAQKPVVFTHCKYIGIEKILFKDLRGKLSSGSCITFDDTQNSYVGHCWFLDFGSTVVELIGADTSSITIEENKFKDCGGGGNEVIRCLPSQLCKDLEIRENIFEGCGRVQKYCIYAGALTEGTIIEENRIYNCVDGGIFVEAYEDAKVFNNYIDEFGSQAIQIYVGSRAGVGTSSLRICEVSNNHIYRKTGTGNYGIQIDGNNGNTGLLLISDNTMFNCAGIRITPSTNISNITIRENIVQDLLPNFFGLLVDTVNGGSAVEMQVHGNFFENEVDTRADAMMTFMGCSNLMVRGNYTKKSGDMDIKLQSCPNAHVIDNVFYQPNVHNVASTATVSIIDSNTNNYYVKRNHIISGTLGHPVALVDVSSPNPNLHISNNTFDDPHIKISLTPNARIIQNGKDAFAQMGRNKQFYSTAVPLAGEYNWGDIVINVNPVAGGKVGWVCVGSGNPGQWRAFGTIEV